MNCSKALVVFSVVNIFFVFVDLSSSTKVHESSASSSSDVCDNPTLTDMFGRQSRQKRSATSRDGCSECGVPPLITMECPGSTISIINGTCARVSSCNDLDPSLESQCDRSDNTSQWATYCKVNNPCIITGSCKAASTCQGDYMYAFISAEYECISDPEQPAPSTSSNSNSNGSPHATTTSPGLTTETPSQTPGATTVHEPLSPKPPSADIVRRKTSLFRQIHERRLQNHVMETKHGLSLVECGAACNQRDDCVSFNIGNGVCELNNQMVGGAGVSGNEFVKFEGYKYYEKQ